MTLGDKFLAVLSSSRYLPLSGENSISNIVDATIRSKQQDDGGNWEYWRWINNMEELGFLYVDLEKRKVFVEPQTIIRSIYSPRELFLIGARTPDYISQIRKKTNDYRLKFQTNPYSPNFPAQIRVIGDEKDLARFSNDLDLSLSIVPRPYNDALRVNRCNDLVRSWQFSDTTSEQGREVRFFNPHTFKFNGVIPDHNLPYNLGLRETRYGKRFNMYRFHRDHLQVKAGVDPRWAKWFCLAKIKFSLLYDQKEKTILIPKYCPLPLPLARSLAMCENIAPQEVSFHFGNSANDTFIKYIHVPKVFAYLISEKLNLPIKSPTFKKEEVNSPLTRLLKKKEMDEKPTRIQKQKIKIKIPESKRK